MAETPAFEFQIDDGVSLPSQLLVGAATPGMAGLIATNHLLTEMETQQIGHATGRHLPAIVPFSEGVPRHPIRLYQSDGGPAMLVSEVFHPPGVAERFADAVGTLTATHGIDEIAVLYGVPYPHGPEDHAVFFVGTEPHPVDHLDGIKPLSGGFFDGYAGRFLELGLSDDAVNVSTLVTPTHLPGPDFEAAIRLVEATESYFDISVDTDELEEQSEEVQRYYEELAERMQNQTDEQDRLTDRMYM